PIPRLPKLCKRQQSSVRTTCRKPDSLPPTLCYVFTSEVIDSGWYRHYQWVQSKERIMNRRVALKSVASAVAGAGLMAMSVAAAGSGQKKNRTAASARNRITPFIEATDGASLFYRQWGAGQPVVFFAPLGLSWGRWEERVNP